MPSWPYQSDEIGPDEWRCGECGTINSEQWTYCDECGCDPDGVRAEDYQPSVPPIVKAIKKLGGA